MPAAVARIDYSVAEVADMLGWSTRTIHRRRQRGEFPGAYKDGGEWRIPSEDVARYRRRRQTGDGPLPPHLRQVLARALAERV